MIYIKYVGSISVTLINNRNEVVNYHTPCTWDSTRSDTLKNVALQMGADYLAGLKVQELKRTDRIIAVTVSVMQLDKNGIRTGGKYYDLSGAVQ